MHLTKAGFSTGKSLVLDAKPSNFHWQWPNFVSFDVYKSYMLYLLQTVLRFFEKELFQIYPHAVIIER